MRIKYTKYTFLTLAFIFLFLSYNAISSPLPQSLETNERAKTSELKQISDLLYNLKTGDLLLLDIDKTLLRTGTHKYMDPVTPIEKEIAKVIEQLQAKGIIVLGLTARSGKNADKTENQLKEIGLDLSNAIHVASISPEYFEKENKNNVKGEQLFKNGILYAKHPPTVSSVKGEVLVAFLNYFNEIKETQKQYGQESKQESLHIFDPSKLKRMIFVDDMQINNDSVQASLLGSKYKDIKFLNYLFASPGQEPTIQKKLKKIYAFAQNSTFQFPETIKDLKFTGKTLAGGSGGVHIFKTDSGEELTLKCNTGNINHFKEELTADALVAASGVGAPDFAIYNHRPEDPSLPESLCPSDQPYYRLARFILISQASTPELVAQKLQDRFVFDAFFANWDIVEKDDRGFKNVILSPERILYSVDHGGALRYRALGQLKSSMPGWEINRVTDLVSMRNPQLSKYGSEVYGKILDESFKKQVQALMNAHPQIMRELSRINEAIKIDNFSELSQMLTNRLQDLSARFLMDETKQTPKISLAHAFDKAIPGKTSAGIFIYTEINGEPYALLGKRIGHEWWGIVGGKSDAEDELLSKTAARESYEETNKLISILPEELNNYPSHDLLTGDELFRMYFFKTNSYVKPRELKSALGSTGDHSREYSEFAWVKVKELLDVVLGSKVIKHDDVRYGEHETLSFPSVMDPQDHASPSTTIILHPPHFKMLRQRPVLKVMSDIVNHTPLKAVHTKGEAEITFAPIQDFDPQQGEITTTWPTIMPSADTKETGVPFGQTASGEVLSERKTKIGKQEITEQIWADPHKEKEQLQRAIITKAQSMSELKKINAEDIKPYKSAKNEEMKKALKDLPLTQSEAHLKKMMQEDYIDVTDENAFEAIPTNIFNFLTKRALLKENFISPDKPHAIKASLEHPFIKTLSEAWLEERKPENRDKIFAYHGASPIIGLLYDLFTEVRRQLLIAGLKENVVARAMDIAFERIFTVDDFIREQVMKQGNSIISLSNYSADYQQKGLSANQFLFGSDGHPTSSTALYVFDGFSASPPPYDNLLNYLKQSIGVEFNNDELLQFLKVFELDKNGRLFQFIFEPEIAEELVYSSYAVGKVSPVQIPGYQPGYYGAFGFIKTARENLEALNQALLNDQNDLNSLQFRIFVHPQKILDPSLVRVKSYWGNSIDAEKLKAYNKKLRIFTQEIILKFLKNKMQISKGDLTTVDQSSDNLTPIQRLEKYVQEGTSGEELQLKSITSSLAQAIYHQDIRLVEKILSQTKYMDLMKEIEYFTPAGASIKFSPFFHIFKNKNFQMLNILERYLLQAGKNVGDEFLRAAKNFRINYEQESADAKVSAIQLALEKGANANLADEKGVPYIVHFCNEAYDMYDTPFKIVKLLLKYNADHSTPHLLI